MRFTGTIFLLSAFFSAALTGHSFAQEADVEFSNQDILTGLVDDPFLRSSDETPENNLPVGYRLNTHAVHQNSPWIYRWLSELSRQKDLQEDAEIQDALVNLVDYHPLRSVSHSAAQFLPRSHEKFQEHIYLMGSEKPSDELFCRPETLGATPLDIADDLRGKLVPKWSISDLSVDGVTYTTEPIQSDAVAPPWRIKITAQAVSGGWIVGYNRELGLHFVPTDDSKPTTTLYPGSYNYISPPDDKGYMWVITDGAFGCHSSSIYRVKETSTGKFDIVFFRSLGGGVRNILSLPNEDLFIDFGTNRKSYAQCGVYSLNQRVGHMMPMGSGFNHPPIGLTQDGKIYKICEKDSQKF